MTTGKDYAVGYRRPPVHTRFKPGQSGNLTGRRGKVRPEGGLLLDNILNKSVQAEPGKPRRITLKRRIVIGLATDAIKGDMAALGTLLMFWENAVEFSSLTPVVIRLSSADMRA